MGLAKLYRKPQTEMYLKMTREQVMGRPLNQCLWCDAPLIKTVDAWCSEEWDSAYNGGGSQEGARQYVIDRDAATCEECGKHEVHYVMAPRIAAEAGGASPGIDMMRTLCEPCMLSNRGTLQPDPSPNGPPIPNVSILRRAWKATGERQRKARYALGPTIVSAVNWARLLNDWKTKRRHPELALNRTLNHFRLVITSLRWLRIAEANSKNPPKILKTTIEHLEEQKTACVLWIHHFRQKEIGVLDA
mgnify:FL=1